MKRILSIFLCIMLVLGSCSFMTACENAATSVGNVIQTNSDVTTDDTSISWSDAKQHNGEYAEVVGTVVGTRYATSSNGKPTFLNVGFDYPDKDRFTILIWSENRGNFSQNPEDYYLNKKVKVKGVVKLYDGVAEIEIDSEDDIQIME